MVIGQISLPNFSVFLLPIIVTWLAVLASGFGMVISALTTKYRDLRQLLAFGLQLWMYATPIVYPLEQIPANLRWIAYVNPVTAPIETSRAIIFGVSFPNSWVILVSLASTTVIFLFGMVLFHRNENTFIDVV
jgi:lipopolysaccharide transport system permease protein